MIGKDPSHRCALGQIVESSHPLFSLLQPRPTIRQPTRRAAQAGETQFTSTELIDAGNPSLVSARQGQTVQVMLQHYPFSANRPVLGAARDRGARGAFGRGQNPSSAGLVGDATGHVQAKLGFVRHLLQNPVGLGAG